MTILTYTGKLHNGKVELATQVNLPEGSEVYGVVSPGIENVLPSAKQMDGWWTGSVTWLWPTMGCWSSGAIHGSGVSMLT